VLEVISYCHPLKYGGVIRRDQFDFAADKTDVNYATMFLTRPWNDSEMALRQYIPEVMMRYLFVLYLAKPSRDTANIWQRTHSHRAWCRLYENLRKPSVKHHYFNPIYYIWNRAVGSIDTPLFCIKGQFYSHMLIRERLERKLTKRISNGRWLEPMETNLKHFKWGSVWIVTSFKIWLKLVSAGTCTSGLIQIRVRTKID